MSDNKHSDEFAERMKRYESVSDVILMHRTPVIIRVDGKNFSKFTRGLEKPFDKRLSLCMQAVAVRLASEAQNCRVAYQQSDEVSLLLTDFRTLTTDPWFDNRVQKLCSTAAAVATAAFATEYMRLFSDEKEIKFPTFDARCLNIPREDVTNYFIWRQRDAERNAIYSAAQSQFSYEELKGVNKSGMMDMLFLRKGINWNDYPVAFKRGLVVVKRQFAVTENDQAVRMRWLVEDAPFFSKDRESIEKFLRDEEMRV